MAERGVPLKPDRDAAWLAFAGWRVNYDRPLVALAYIVMAPYAPWSSDRRPVGATSPLQLMKRKHLAKLVKRAQQREEQAAKT